MDFHEIDLKGKLWIERVATLPAWAATDVGRLVYAVDEDVYYKASAVAWAEFGQPLSTFAGLVIPTHFDYSSTATIGLTPAKYHHSGTIDQLVGWASDITFVFGSGGSNAASENLGTSEWHYLYIDDSALSGDTITAARLINNTTGPTFNGTKGGWYNGNDRCIGAFWVNSSGNLEIFYHTGKYIQWDTYVSLGTGSVSTSWGVTTATLRLPSFSKAGAMTFYTSGNNKDVFLYWRESNSSAAGHLVGRNYDDDSGDNQGNSNSIVSVSIVNVDLTNKIIDLKASGSSLNCARYQDGYWLPEYGI